MSARGSAAPPRPHVILFFGAPGSGKGTQSSLLAAELGIPALSTGEMLRAEAQRKTPAGRKLRRVLASGALVADELVCDAVASRLEREIPRGGLILDGFPRTLAQANCLDNILRGMNLPGPTVLHLHVSRERIVSRLAGRRHCTSCGAIFNLVSRPSAQGTVCENDGGALVQREDDSEAVILKRLAAFDLASAPLVDYYSDGDYHWIDGDRSTETVASQLLSIVRSHAIGKAPVRKLKINRLKKSKPEKAQAAA